MPKEIFVVRNWITLQAAILDCSEEAIHSHSFSKVQSLRPTLVSRVQEFRYPDKNSRICIINKTENSQI